MGNAWVSPSISHRMGKCNKAHRFEIVTHNFPTVWVFFPIRFTSYGILHLMENAYGFLSVSHNIGKDSQTHQMGKDWEIGCQ